LAVTKTLQNTVISKFFNSKTRGNCTLQSNRTPKLCLGLKKISSNLKPIMSLGLNYQDFENKGFLLKKQFIQSSLESHYKGIDAYFLKKYPENHPKYSHYISDTAYWQHLFSKTKPNRNQQSFSKDFLKLIL
jgi:hypothetical protein